MKAMLFGIQKVNFKPEDGELIQGIKLHYFTAPSDTQIENFNGYAYEKQWVARDSKADMFGFSASELFDKFNDFKESLTFPEDVEVLYELNGRKPVFAGVRLATK